MQGFRINTNILGWSLRFKVCVERAFRLTAWTVAFFAPDYILGITPEHGLSLGPFKAFCSKLDFGVEESMNNLPLPLKSSYFVTNFLR